MKDVQKGSRAWDFLNLLIDGWEIYYSNFKWPRRIEYDYEEWLAIENIKEKKARRQAIKRLEKKRIIKIEKKGKKMTALLTNEGLIQALIQKTSGEKSLLPSNQICLVTFDIPEYVKNVRNLFRALLKELGFKQAQRSVWEGDKNVIDQLKILIDRMKANDWINIYIAYEQ